MSNPILPNQLQGAWTALVTPFSQDESIDFQAFEGLIEAQIKAGITGILLNGTTGESPTITDDEFSQLIKRGKQIIDNRVPLMVGVGTNCTRTSIEKAQVAADLGADVLLVVNPYYNKPTQQGLYLHFKAIAEATPLPIMLYNIKSRTSVNIETDTLLRLINDTPNIVGVKEASGDLAQIKEVCEQTPNDFVVLSGDDNITFKIMRDYCAHGVISVISNLVPEQVVKMTKLCLKASFEEANKINQELEALIAGAFWESNPIPIKASLAMQGKIQEVYRLPMCKMSANKRKEWENLLQQNNLL